MDPEKKKEIRREYMVKGSMIFLLIAACLIFAFCVFQYGIVWRHVSRVLNVLKPIFYGIVIAYLVNPIVEIIHKGLSKLFSGPLKKLRHTEKVIRIVGVVLALLIFLLLIVLCFYLIIPQFVECISELVKTLPSQAAKTTDRIIRTLRTKVSRDVFIAGEKWLEGTLIPRLGKWVTGMSWAGDLASGIGVVISFFKNFLIGLICALYLLINKSLFLRQSRKLILALFKKSTAENVLQVCKKTNSIFSGFINGKLLDSLIIGILCFIGVTVLRIPYAVLVSVIVGITNVIPVFGPYIGGVPCFILVFLSSPIKGITFGVFVILLQTLDGNFIGPKILGGKTGIETFWVVFAITVGGGLFGVFGMLIGVPTFAIGYYLLRGGVNRMLKRKHLPTDNRYYTENVTDKLNSLKMKENKAKADSVAPKIPAKEEVS